MASSHSYYLRIVRGMKVVQKTLFRFDYGIIQKVIVLFLRSYTKPHIPKTSVLQFTFQHLVSEKMMTAIFRTEN